MQNLTDLPIKQPSDITWPKDFPELKLIDDALKCGICYDYIKTCMVTPCAHSYCSICIRRSLQYKTACPICFEETFEINLRNNRVLDRVSELFSSIKDKLVKHLKVAAVHFNSQEQIASPLISQNLASLKSSALEVTPKRGVKNPVKSSSKGKIQFSSIGETSNSKSSGIKSNISRRLEDILGSPTTSGSLKNESDYLLVSSPTVPPMFLHSKPEAQNKSLDAPLVPCPVCNVSIPERNINTHLDNCLANVDKPPIKSPVKIKQKRIPLPKMVWSLMGEKDLRKKLKEYGLNTQGDKKSLTSRIQRYILLYNSECDSDNPRPVLDIVRQVEREEKQTPAQSHQRLFNNNKCDPKAIEEENKKYIQDNKSSFNKLIEAMKEREGQNIKPLSNISRRILSDDEDSVNIENQKPVDSCPSRLKYMVDFVDLCDNTDNLSETLSPVLGDTTLANEDYCNGRDFVSRLEEQATSNGDQKTAKRKENQNSDLDQLCSLINVSDPEDNSDTYPVEYPVKDSDSEDSFSLLTNQNTANGDFLFNTTEPFTEYNPSIDSQIEDPNFVLDTEHEENNSDEVFVPQRKLKRKHRNLVPAKSIESPSPRRTRRRVSK